MAADGSNGCKGAVSKAVGREISDDEFAKVAGDIDRTLRMLWKTERAKMATMSKADQQRYAASVAANQLQAQAALKVRRLALSIARNAENMAYLESRGMTFAAFNDITSFGASLEDGGPGRVSVESQARATAEMAKAELIDLVEASGGRFFGFIEDGAQVRAFVRALFGERTDNPAMAKAAQAWRTVTDGMRERFNRAGGDIGNLGDLWHLPQVHDAYRIAKAGADAWINGVLPKLDRRQYVNADGSMMDDAQVTSFLREAYRSIVTDGANKREALGRPKGAGSRANRHGESRALFFRDGDSYMDYQLEYGGQNIYSVMFNHLDTMAKDIALVETFGPNAEANARLLMDTLRLRNDLKGGEGVTDGKNAAAAWRANAIFEEVAGIGQGPASAGWAGRMAAMRSWMTATRLGSAVLSSITDHATIIQTAWMWNLPVMQVYRNYWKALNPLNKTELRDLQRQGLAINVFASSLDRFSGDYGGMRTHKVANAVMRASGLTAITDARRRAFSATMMSVLGDMVKSKAWDQLDASDMKLLKAKGVTPETYAIWQKAKQETTPDYPGGLLSGRSIMAIDDSVVAEIIDPTIKRIGADANARAKEVLAKAESMRERILAKQEQHEAYTQKLRGMLSSYMETRAKSLGEKQTKADAVSDTLAAQVERAEVEGDLAAFARTAMTEEGLRKSLSDAEAGKAQAGDILDEKTKRLFEKYGASRGSIGERIATARETAKRRIAVADERIKKHEAVYNEQIKGKAKELGIRALESERQLANYSDRIFEYIDSYVEQAQRIERGVGKSQREAVMRAREKAATHFMGIILEEQNMAIIEAGARERALLYAGTKKGTFGGELARAVMQFKTFPFAMLTRHWVRSMSAPSVGGRAAQLASLFAMSTITGALAMEIKAIIDGKDPRSLWDEDDPKAMAKTWAAAALQGGALGIFGDFLNSTTSRGGSDFMSTLSGPIPGMVGDVANLALGNPLRAVGGSETDIAADSVRILKGLTPGASLWYAKAAFNNLVFGQLQEMASPGYLDRMRRKTTSETGQEFWWEPGEATPERAPDLGAVVEG